MTTESSSSPAVLRTYVNDMMTLSKHILEALERQAEDERVKNSPLAAGLVSHVKSTLTRQVNDLSGHVDRLGSQTGAVVKEAITSALGVAAGLYDKVRKDPVSRMLRDDYTALNLAAMSYTMLYTTALAFHDQSVATTAIVHLNELTPLIMRYNEVAPYLVVAELTDDGATVDTSIAEDAVSKTQAAWKR